MACCCLTGTMRSTLVLAFAAAAGLGLVAALTARADDPKPTPTPAPPAAPATPAAPQAPAKPGMMPAPAAPADPAYVLGFTVKSIDGKDVNLADYKGKVVMIVNVASKCGLTPQYEALEKLYKAKKDAGLVILGFPANNFKNQEPGTEKEIAEFCTSKYSVTFPMFAKVSVKGADQAPLYKKITSLPKPVGEEPSWNFTKYLVDRDGRVVARFDPQTKPDDKAVTEKIDVLLAAKATEKK
ncbi:MAG: glutathione peroxidase [Phycisphaerales bacterium]